MKLSPAFISPLRALTSARPASVLKIELMPRAKEPTARAIRTITSARRRPSLPSGSWVFMLFWMAGLSLDRGFLFICYKMAMTMKSSSRATHTPSVAAKAMTPLRQAL